MYIENEANSVVNARTPMSIVPFDVKIFVRIVVNPLDGTEMLM